MPYFLHRPTWPMPSERHHTKAVELRPDQAATDALAHASRQPPAVPGVVTMSQADLAKARIATEREQAKSHLKMRPRKWKR